MDTRLPVISIITVVYNAASLLEGTIQSVARQTYPHIEYLVIDGGSTDGTVEVIRRHENAITRWISEPDRGLYDAMNKGLRLATGDFVWFVNAGDRLFQPDTVERMVAQYTPETDVLYGEVMLVDEARRHLGTRTELTVHQLPGQLHWEDMRYGMIVCHQGFVARRTLAAEYPPGNLTADIDWVIRILKKSRQTVHTHLILAEYLTGGISKKRHQQSLRDRYQVLRRHFGWLPNLIHHGVILLRAFFFRIKMRGKERY